MTSYDYPLPKNDNISINRQPMAVQY